MTEVVSANQALLALENQSALVPKKIAVRTKNSNLVLAPDALVVFGHISSRKYGEVTKSGRIKYQEIFEHLAVLNNN